MAKKVTIDNMDTVIQQIFDEYTEEVGEGLHKAAVDTGKVGVNALKDASRSAFENRNKKKPYWRGWKVTDESGRMTTSVIIHNATVPGLPHLLEHGHANRGGGRTPGTAHIAPVEKKLVELFEKNFKVNI